MANKLRLVIKNLIDIGTLTDSPVSTTVNNLKDYSRSKNFTTSSVGIGLHTVFLTLTETHAVNSAILGRHNFPVGTQFRIYLYSDSAWTNIVHDSTLLTISEDQAGSNVTNWGEFNWGTIVWGEDSVAEAFELKPNYTHWLDSPVVIQSMKLELLTPTQELEIGRLIVGNYIEPTYNISYGHGLSWVENTRQFRKEGNTLRSTIYEPSKKLTFDLRTINETDRAILQSNFRDIGLRKDMFISIFPEDIDLDKVEHYSGIVKLTKIPSTSEYAHMYYNSKYEMEEV
jgi:hypothetical protein